jgi:hypothetical protein
VKPVELFHIGPQKAASSWVYRCLSEHPRIACPPRDTIHYFDMFYAKGRDWYATFFEAAGDDQMLFDPTYTYIRSPWAPERIARENPAARIVLCLRNPIERAFSHYWHERKKRVIHYEFPEVLGNYDLFASWVEPGFYAAHLKRYLEHFPRGQILCQRFEQLETDPPGFLRELLDFAGVDPDFEPTLLHERVAPAGAERRLLHPGYYLFRSQRLLRRLGIAPRTLERIQRRVPGLRWHAAYDAGVAPDLHAALLEICEPEIRELEKLLDRDLSGWHRRRPPTREP